MEVLIKVTVVLATYLEEDNVLLRAFQLCYVLTPMIFRKFTAHTFHSPLTEGNAVYLKAFQEQTIPDTETILLSYWPDRRWSAILSHLNPTYQTYLLRCNL